MQTLQPMGMYTQLTQLLLMHFSHSHEQAQKQNCNQKRTASCSRKTEVFLLFLIAFLQANNSTEALPGAGLGAALPAPLL